MFEMLGLAALPTIQKYPQLSILKKLFSYLINPYFSTTI